MTEGEEDTMIVVTSDHSHSMAMNGYHKRGNSIDGVAGNTSEGFAYETLSYINGPGYRVHRNNSIILGTNSTLQTKNTWRNVEGLGNRNGSDRYQPHLAGFWTEGETHGGEDVLVCSMGPMSHLLHGVMEQTQVPFALAYSVCIGPYEGPSCKGRDFAHGPNSKGKGHGHDGGLNGSNRPCFSIFCILGQFLILVLCLTM